ncbi:17827_t:CDS:2 [Entrophospora sp. SA101]|nr:17821_t:CDS:2 [Entrophospora sp. SA101]CAJ0924579.1 17823_t:CDS:2 [Entrophospora sp. SA101]CAJ0924589.1 17827_t:CDS:2 [Entrophospora sp. SA101]
MIPLYEWRIGGINITQRFRQYQQKVVNKVKSNGLTWKDSYEILALSSIIILAHPCPYPDFTEIEWYTITIEKPFMIEQPIIPSSISNSLQEATRKHLMHEDSYIYADRSILGRAAASTFNDLRNIPPLAPSKMSEDLHCCNLLYPHVRPIFNQLFKDYDIQLNRAVKGTRKRPDFSCLVDKIPVLVSEFKPLGCTPLQKKRDFVRVHLRAKKSLNQQLNLKGGPGEVMLFTNMGDVISSFSMDLSKGLCCSWSFHTTKLTIDRAQYHW